MAARPVGLSGTDQTLERAFGLFDLLNQGSLAPALLKHVSRAATDYIPDDDEVRPSDDPPQDHPHTDRQTDWHTAGLHRHQTALDRSGWSRHCLSLCCCWQVAMLLRSFSEAGGRFTSSSLRRFLLSDTFRRCDRPGALTDH